MRRHRLIRYLPFLALAGLAVQSIVPSGAADPVAVAATVAGEHAPYRVDGDVVHVDNRLCTVSHAPIHPDVLGTHAMTVSYEGSDPRFAGRDIRFNLCCSGCVEQLPGLWAADADAILAFHGLLDA